MPELLVSPLSDKMSPYITPEQLAANANAYLAMQADLTSKEERQIEAIKGRLVDVPLTHCTSEDGAAGIQEKGIVPLADAKRKTHNTFPLDEHLGLDEYAFAYWGETDETSNLGNRLVRLTGSLLLSDRTIVTPDDITMTQINKRISPADLAKPEYTEKLKEFYFNTMVRGKDWLEIVARNVHAHAKKYPDVPYPTRTIISHQSGLEFTGLGEIKHRGTIDPSHIVGEPMPFEVSGEGPSKILWRTMMYRHGMAPNLELETLQGKARYMPFVMEGGSPSMQPAADEARAFVEGTWGRYVNE